MSASFAVLLALSSATSVPAIDAGSSARVQGAALAAACKSRDGWSDPAPPARIFGNTWYVGTCGISVLLITGRDGHVLIDSSTAEAAPAILASIRQAGFDPRDIRLIVGSHEHYDHMGGVAALKNATGARFVVRGAARAVLESGRVASDDPQRGMLADLAPVTVDRSIADGEVLRLGNLALTTVATPGHTAGGTSWTWRVCERSRCLNFAYVDSLTAVSAETYRFTDHPERVAPFRTTFAKVARLRCDVLLTPHSSPSNLLARLAGMEPLVDRNACARLSKASAHRLDERLAREAGTGSAAGKRD